MSLLHQLDKNRTKRLVTTTCMILLPSSTKGDRGNSVSPELLKAVLGEEVGKEPHEEADVVVHVVSLDILGRIVLS